MQFRGWADLWPCDLRPVESHLGRTEGPSAATWGAPGRRASRQSSGGAAFPRGGSGRERAGLRRVKQTARIYVMPRVRATEVAI
jgi:hypothetical protein